MKFLIENYSTPDSTQPLYFNKHLNETSEHRSILRQNNASIFDIFDTIRPDVYISSFNTLSKDALLYLQENKHIKFLMSIDGLQQQHFLKLEDILQSYEVSCHFFFSVSGQSYSRKYRFVSIRHAADINIKQDLSIVYKAEKCIIVNKDDPSRNYKKDYNGTYHVITNNQSLLKKSDAYLPITLMPSIYNMYEEIIFTDIGSELPQSFFDALYYGKRVYYDIKNENIAQKIDDAVSHIFGVNNVLNYNAPNKLEDFSAVKNIVNEKHLSTNRTKTLLSQLPQKT